MDLLEQYTKKLVEKKRGGSPKSPLYSDVIKFYYEGTDKLYFVNACAVQVEVTRNYSSFRYEGSGESVVIPDRNTTIIDITTDVSINDVQFIRTIAYRNGYIRDTMLTNMSVETNSEYSIYRYQFVGH